MTDETQSILERALSLPYEDRAQLEESLYESLHRESGGGALDENSPGYADEIGRRVAEIKSGSVEASPWADVKKRILLKHQK